MLDKHVVAAEPEEIDRLFGEADARSMVERARKRRARYVDNSKSLKWRVTIAEASGLRTGTVGYEVLPTTEAILSDARRQGYMGQILIEAIDVERVRPRTLVLLPNLRR
ncbi:hypothetical protein KUV47_09195 [Vannielia litorea]|uniref:hypothetical protein n=1 Tax=Vannielia litorea TaxID=1217970 RepID=UPI001C94F3E9|nr:hypothetical protein [Vannielia litorea]MBY6153384.1 hypothetical protein [Vannielia litorea]